MRTTALIAASCAALLATGCTTVVYHVAEKPAPDGNGIFVLRPDGSDPSAGAEYADGRYPHVTPDGSLLFVKQFPAGASQVFRGSQQVTDSDGAKRDPAASQTAVAYVHVIPSRGPHIVVRSNAGTDQLLLASDATGLAFYDNGSKLVYSQRDGVYSTASSGTPNPTRVAECLTTPPSGCGPLAVSHNGQYLAYYTYVVLAPGRVEFIQISRVGTWQPILRISPRDFCPTCVAGAPGMPEQLGSFDFSPDDKYLYSTVRVAGPGTGPAARNRDEIFRLQLNLNDTPPTVSAPERLTNNAYPDYHPSTRQLRRFW
jgi:hypothetical protein